MIRGIDHVAVPMENTAEMLAFYRRIGAEVTEEIPDVLHSAYLGDSKINLHMPRAWKSPRFDLRGPAAVPGCGDVCLVWAGSMSELQSMLANAGAEIIEGPVERMGGLRRMGVSVYVRDPDRNLLEFIVYRDVD